MPEPLVMPADEFALTKDIATRIGPLNGSMTRAQRDQIIRAAVEAIVGACDAYAVAQMARIVVPARKGKK
jgi:hypothetical protein